MKKIVAILSALMLAIVLVGCASQEQAPEPEPVQEDPSPMPIEVVKSGFWLDHAGTAHCAAIVKNPNDDWKAQNIETIFTGKNAEGASQGSQSAYITLLYATGETGVCRRLINSPAAVDVQVVDKSQMWEEDSYPQADLNAMLYTQNINETHDVTRYTDHTTVAGELVNNTDNEYQMVAINVVFFSEDGTVLGGDSNYVQTSAPHSTTPFSVNYIEDVPAHASVQAYIDCERTITKS